MSLSMCVSELGEKLANMREEKQKTKTTRFGISLAKVNRTPVSNNTTTRLGMSMNMEHKNVSNHNDTDKHARDKNRCFVRTAIRDGI